MELEFLKAKFYPGFRKKLTEKVDITMANLSILKTAKAKTIRFSTLDAICKALNCKPGDILEFVEWFVINFHAFFAIEI